MAPTPSGNYKWGYKTAFYVIKATTRGLSYLQSKKMKDINVIEDKAVEPVKKSSVHSVLSASTFYRKHSVYFVLIFFILTKFLK